MPSDSGDRRQMKPIINNQSTLPLPPPDHQQQAEQPQLQCPRCESRNTKFCYYNNYNLSQPRHFCKSCRRYWTQGGTLRNIPIGGGTRKNNPKRSRTTSHQENPISANPISTRPGPGSDTPSSDDVVVDLNVSNGGLGFTSLLHSQGPGFLALGGFGLGIGSGFDDMGGYHEIGKGVWPYLATDHQVGGEAAGTTIGGGGVGTWQLGNGGDGGFGETTECFSWPELSISTPRKGVK